MPSPVNWSGEGISHTVATDRTSTITNHRLGVNGTLMNLGVEVVTGSPKNNVYVRLSRFSSSGAFRGDICYGYLNAVRTPDYVGGIVISADDRIRLESWAAVACTMRLTGSIMEGSFIPAGGTAMKQGNLEGQGAIRHFLGSDAAAGANFSDSCPTGARQRIDSMMVTFVTSTIVGSARTMSIIADNAALGKMYKQVAGDTQANSLTFNYVLWRLGILSSAEDAQNELTLPLAEGGITLQGGDRIKSSVGSLQALDDISPVLYQLREWLDID